MVKDRCPVWRMIVSSGTRLRAPGGGEAWAQAVAGDLVRVHASAACSTLHDERDGVVGQAAGLELVVPVRRASCRPKRCRVITPASDARTWSDCSSPGHPEKVAGIEYQVVIMRPGGPRPATTGRRPACAHSSGQSARGLAAS